MDGYDTIGLNRFFLSVDGVAMVSLTFILPFSPLTWLASPSADR